MDWDEKFSSIVNETESTLMKIRESIEFGRSLKFEESSAKKIGLSNNFPNANFVADREFYNSSPIKSSTDLFSILTLMRDRIESQNKSLEYLTKSVMDLETNKESSQWQITALKDEVTFLRERLSDEGRNMKLERRFEQWKRDLSSQIQLLQSRILSAPNRINDENSSTFMHRDFIDLKRNIDDDLRSIRNEIDTLRARINHCESQVCDRLLDYRHFSKSTNQLQTNECLDVVSNASHGDLTVNDLMESQRHANMKINRMINEPYGNKKNTRKLLKTQDFTGKSKITNPMLPLKNNTMPEHKTQYEFKEYRYENKSSSINLSDSMESLDLSYHENSETGKEFTMTDDLENSFTLNPTGTSVDLSLTYSSS